MTDIWAAVDRLTNPIRERIERDGGRLEWITLPSLYDQLAEAVQNGAGSQARGVQASRPPLDAIALSLLVDIDGTIREACRDRDVKRAFDTHRDLRGLASSLLRESEGDELDWWTGKLGEWAGEIRAVISSDPDRPTRLHSIPCPACRATHVTERDGTDHVRRPAIVVSWANGYVRAVECRMCGAVWFRGADLEKLADDLITFRDARDSA